MADKMVSFRMDEKLTDRIDAARLEAIRRGGGFPISKIAFLETLVIKALDAEFPIHKKRAS